MSKTLDKTWFATGHGHCIGIVLCEDEVTKEKKAYISVVSGEDEEADTQDIKENGAKFVLPKTFKEAL